jgi:hypothetical protein
MLVKPRIRSKRLARAVREGLDLPRFAQVWEYTWTETQSEAYTGMNKYYREYRRDELVRRGLNALGFFATSFGFEVQLEVADPQIKKSFLKAQDPKQAEAEYITSHWPDLLAFINDMNRVVNADQVWMIGDIKKKIWGHAAFEVVLGKNMLPQTLLPLDSEKIEPHLNRKWELLGFNYDGRRDYFTSEQIIWLPNQPSLYADLRGLSDIEPILTIVQDRQEALRTDLPEMRKAQWGGIRIHQVDTTNMSDTDADEFMTAYTNALRPTKDIVVNKKISVEVLFPTINWTEFWTGLDKEETRIIGATEVPPFLLGREESVNRATSQTEFEAFLRGPIAREQRALKREIERQWYERLIRAQLGVKPPQQLPIRAVHVWSPIRTVDWADKAQAVAQLYSDGVGCIDQQKAWELLDFDITELQKRMLEKQQQIQGTPEWQKGKT